MGKVADNSTAQYVLIERAFEIMKFLKEDTHAGKSLTQSEILKHIDRTTNERTLSTTIDKLIRAVNPNLSEQLNMFYDKPQPISLKIQNDRYTVLHDWFGNRFQVRRELDEQYDEGKASCPNG